MFHFLYAGRQWPLFGDDDSCLVLESPSVVRFAVASSSCHCHCAYTHELQSTLPGNAVVSQLKLDGAAFKGRGVGPSIERGLAASIYAKSQELGLPHTEYALVE